MALTRPTKITMRVKPSYLTGFAASLSLPLLSMVLSYFTLKSNGLVLKSEMAALQTLQPAIVLFAVAAMHNCKVEIEKGLIIPLKASPHGETGIVVNAAIPTGDPNSQIFI